MGLRAPSVTSSATSLASKLSSGLSARPTSTQSTCAISSTSAPTTLEDMLPSSKWFLTHQADQLAPLSPLESALKSSTKPALDRSSSKLPEKACNQSKTLNSTKASPQVDTPLHSSSTPSKTHNSKAQDSGPVNTTLPSLSVMVSVDLTTSGARFSTKAKPASPLPAKPN